MNEIPKLGEGIFLIKDVADILGLPYYKVRHFINEYWDKRFYDDMDGRYSFGSKRDKAVNFYTLIEFYTFYKLREKNIPSQTIHKAHHFLAKELKTPYPFAHAGIRTLGKEIWAEIGNNILKLDGRMQLAFGQIIKPLLHKIEYGNDNIANKFYPLSNSKNVVVDPLHQYGQPTIKGTNIKTTTIFNLYIGGEPYKFISDLYNIPLQKVKDAVLYHKTKIAA